MFTFSITSLWLTKKTKLQNPKIFIVLPYFTLSVCRYWVHTVKCYVFHLSSPPTQIHRNTFLEPCSPNPFISLYLLQQTILLVHPETREATLSAAPGPLGLYPAAVLESGWTDHPPPSGVLQMERRVEWGQDGNTIQSRSQTLSCQYYKCNWKHLKVLLMLVDIWTEPQTAFVMYTSDQMRHHWQTNTIQFS